MKRTPVGIWASGIALIVYALSLAHTVTLWDAGEFLAAIHALGIPHPPGTPLFVLLARVWSIITSPVLGFTLAVNAFSAVCAAVAVGVVATLIHRWTRDAVGAVAGAVCAGVMSSVWLNATETEVYACTLAMGSLIVWTAARAEETREARWAILTAYLCGLGWALHLSSLIVAPAALVLIFAHGQGRFSQYRPAHYVFGALTLVLGMSAVLFLIVRARHDPAINQGNPVTWHAMWDVIQRKQYDVAALWPRRAPWWLQIGNLIEYADWQFALGFAPDPPPSWVRTPITIGYAILGVYGSMVHRRASRTGWRAWMMLLVTASLGIVVYLNLRAGPSFGAGILPASALHEARERDYFFVWAFVCWGVWAGLGAVASGRKHGHALAAAIVAASLPIVGNWSMINAERHAGSAIAEQSAIKTLQDVPPRGIYLAIGDNDTYPLWYMQQVRGVRRDVTVVTIPLLAPQWYRAELRRRYQLLGDAFVTMWQGSDATIAEIQRQAAKQHRPIIGPTLRM